MYYTIFGQCESIDDASYERVTENDDGTTTTEKVAQVQVTLAIPGQRDLVKITFAAEDIQAKASWEDQMTMLKVMADKFTLSTGIRSKKAWGLVSFHGLQVTEASAQEQSQLAGARKQVKARAKKKREEAKAKSSKSAA